MREKERKIIFFLAVLFDRLLKLFSLRYDFGTINKGVSFSWLSDTGFNVLLPTAFLLLIALLIWVFRRNIGFQLILIGGLSNLLDRFFYGGVVDFIPFLGFFHFNLADLFVTFGLAVVFIDLVKREKV